VNNVPAVRLLTEGSFPVHDSSSCKKHGLSLGPVFFAPETRLRIVERYIYAGIHFSLD